MSGMVHKSWCSGCMPCWCWGKAISQLRSQARAGARGASRVGASHLAPGRRGRYRNSHGGVQRARFAPRVTDDAAFSHDHAPAFEAGQRGQRADDRGSAVKRMRGDSVARDAVRQCHARHSVDHARARELRRREIARGTTVAFAFAIVVLEEKGE